MVYEDGTTSDIDLTEYLRVLRRRKGIIALFALAGIAGALVYSFLQTPMYRAGARVLLQPRAGEAIFDSQNDRSQSGRRAETEIEVIRSEPVAAAVRDAMGTVPPVSASVIGNTDVIRITAQSEKPRVAAAAANAYAAAYVDFRRKQTVDDLQAASEEIGKRVSDLQKRIDDMTVEIDRQVAAAPALQQSQVRASISSPKDALLQQQALLRQQVDELQIGSALSTGQAQIVGPANVPSSPFSPKPQRNGAVGLAIGLLLGVGVAFLREHLDDTVKTQEGLTKITGGIPVAGLIPAVHNWKSKSESRLVSITEPNSPATEAYRTLRTSIQFLSLEHPIRTLQITSARAEEGKTTTLANLGVALASAGQRVVLTCCDLRRPRIHEFFGLSNAVGVTSVLLGEAPVSTALQPVPGQRGLSLLASGPLPPNPSELLSSPRITELFSALEKRADIILIDCPPVLPVTDALVIAGRVNATLLTCLAGSTTEKQMTRAIQLLRGVDAPLVGTVLNGVTADEPYGYTYGYYRYDQRKGDDERPNGDSRKGRRRAKAEASSAAPSAASTGDAGRS